MRVRQVAKWSRRLTLLRISTIAIIVTSLLSISIMAVTYYGDKVGNYIVSVKKDTLWGLSLSEMPDFTSSSANLIAPGVKNLTNITYGTINPSDKTHLGGSHNRYEGNQGMYFAYTFYLRNESTQPVSYNATIDIEGEFLDVSSAVRIMVIKDGLSTIYAKARPDGTAEDHQYLEQNNAGYGYSTQMFLDGKHIVNQKYIIGLKETHKYTVILWLEGEDEQCTNAIKGGSIRLAMGFEISSKK
ncbi:MAG: hypothetical protein RR248_02135 [Clostridia bacterium]